jgi:outer membrane protein OmpA-like peptidoglycan-associated protein
MNNSLTQIVAIAVPVVVIACSTPPLIDAVSAPLRPIGTEQVRDPLTGKVYFVACNPCAAPTPKTEARPVASKHSQVLPPVAVPLATLPSSSGMPAPDGMTSREQIDRNPAVPPDTATTPMPSVAIVAKTPPVVPVAVAPLPGKMSVNFAPYSTQLDAQALRGLEPLLKAGARAGRVVILGAADTSGSAEGNRILALKRATAVRSVFVAAGIPTSRIKVSACTSCFVAPNDTPAGRSANRRAEVEIS